MPPISREYVTLKRGQKVMVSKFGDQPHRVYLALSCVKHGCRTKVHFTANAESWDAWDKGNGTHKIEAYFPYLMPHVHEMLVTGLCDTCWGEILGPTKGDE